MTHVLLHTNKKQFGEALIGGGASDDLTDVQIESNDIDNVGTIPLGTTQITFSAHSTEQFLSNKRDVSAHSADELAEKIKKKFEGDKSTLQDFYLISCEAGLKIGENKSFAEAFSEKMYKKGFTSLKVHAMSHPIDTNVHGMIVQIERYVSQNTQISSWYYRTKQHDERDHVIEKELKDSQLSEEQSLKLKKEQEGLRVYVCREQNHKDVMDLKHNTFQQGKALAAMSPLVNEAISTLLREQVKKTTMFSGGIERQALGTLITKLYEKPDANVDSIISCFDAAAKSLKSKIIDETFIKNIRFVLLSRIAPEKLETKDYIEQLRPNADILDRIINTINGTASLTESLANSLKMMQNDQLVLDKQRKELREKLPDEKIMQKVIIALTGKSKQEEFKAAMRTYLDNPESSEWDKVVRAHTEYKKTGNMDNNLVDVYKEIETNHEGQVALNNKQKELLCKITTIVDNYLTKHRDDNDEMHLAKKEVMRAIRVYILSPTDENWQAVTKKTSSSKNWDKGLFSKVSSIYKQVEHYHDNIPEEHTPRLKI